MREKQNQIIPFGYGDNLVRVVEDNNNTPFWIAKDVVRILGLENASEATKSLDDDEVLNLKQILKNKEQLGLAKKQGLRYDAIIINESGLYTLIFKSQKEEAKKFRKWVTSEVLPTIRKTGSYGVSKAGVSEHILNQMIEANKEIHPVMLDIMQQNKEIQLATQKTNEALLKVTTALVDVSKTLSSITEKMNTVDKKVEEIEKKTSYTAEISIRADKVLGKTYNYLKYQPMTHEERKRLNEKIKERGKILSKQHSLDIEVATSSIYRLLNKQYGLSSYHELEHKDILSALDWVEFCELGNWEGESTLKDPLDDVYPDTQRTNARNIYGDRFMD